MSADDSALERKLRGAPVLISPIEPGEVVYPSAGVRTYPAPAGITATVRVEDVLAGPDVAMWGTGSSRETELRLVTTGDSDPRTPPTGVIKRAAWVVTIYGTTPVFFGGPRGRPPRDPTLTGTSTVIVDAETGAVLRNHQEVGPVREDPVQ